MKSVDLIKKLKGMHTIESIMSKLNVNKQKAIYYIYRLRKEGYVQTKKTSENKRVYHISFENKLGGKSYIDIINENSPIKVYSSNDFIVYGESIGAEEALVYAIKTKNFRIILASLPLFRKIRSWTKLYKLAKSEKIQKEIGALYDLIRGIFKIRKMTKRFRKNILPRKNEKYKYIVDNLESKDYNEIEKVWKVHIPFNKKDLIVYKMSEIFHQSETGGLKANVNLECKKFLSTKNHQSHKFPVARGGKSHQSVTGGSLE